MPEPNSAVPLPEMTKDQQGGWGEGGKETKQTSILPQLTIITAN